MYRIKDILKTILIGFITTGLFILPDFIFGMFQKTSMIFTLGKCSQIYIYSLLSVLIYVKKLRMFLWIFWCVFMSIELCHLAFFGQPTTPYTYIWMMGELKDTFDGAIHSINLFYAPLSVIIPFIVLFYLDKKFDRYIKRSKVATVILFIAFTYMAIDVNRQNRSFFYMASSEKLPTFISTIRKPSFVFFKAIPKFLLHGYDTSFKPYEVTKIKSPEKINIIYIFGESGNPNYMSIDSKNNLVSKDRTTPQLEKYKSDKNFWYTRGFSSGVATIYSVMMNFYMQREPENHDVQENKKTDILKLAKDAGFKSWLIEAQGTHPDYDGKIDIVRFVGNEVNEKGEEIVLNYFPSVNELSNKNLIVYQQDIMHFDYKDHYKKFGNTYEIFKPKNNTTEEIKISEYKNAVFYWDFIMGKIFDYANNISKITKAPTYIVYMSDHGELIGGNKRGHSMLSKEVATIPIFVKCFNCKDINEFKNIKTATHYRVNEKILNLFGYKLYNPNDDGKTIYINGKSLYGDDGFITITD